MNFVTLAADLDEQNAYLYEACIQLDVLRSQVWDLLPGAADFYARTLMLDTLDCVHRALSKALG
jgi:hypothetical protein